MSIKCLIVDDEPIAAKGIAGYADKISNLEVVSILYSALELNEFLQKETVDLIFLDIEMPYLSGLNWLKSYKNPPAVIFTTAYHEYAVEGFDLDVVDYLLKPVSFERFLKAINKVRDTSGGIQADHIFIKVEGRLEKVLFEEILCVESLQNYVTFICESRRLISHLTLKSVEEQLPGSYFLKTHKSYLINKSKVQALEGNRIKLSQELNVPIGKTIREEVIQEITKNTLKK